MVCTDFRLWYITGEALAALTRAGFGLIALGTADVTVALLTVARQYYAQVRAAIAAGCFSIVRNTGVAAGAA